MDKNSYVSQSQPLNEASGGGASTIACDDELPHNISQINFQTMKAANDTTKVCMLF